MHKHPTSREKPESTICSGRDPLSGMGKTYCVIGCFNWGGHDNISFFQFPSVIENQGKASYKELLLRWQDLWIASAKRRDSIKSKQTR